MRTTWLQEHGLRAADPLKQFALLIQDVLVSTLPAYQNYHKGRPPETFVDDHAVTSVSLPHSTSYFSRYRALWSLGMNDRALARVNSLSLVLRRCWSGSVMSARRTSDAAALIDPSL